MATTSASTQERPPDSAGRAVPHLDVRVIPRYAGDMDDPRGGVRYVIPSRGN